MDQLQKCDANYVPLTPVTFLKRASAVYANRTSVIYEGTRFTWRQTYERCCRLADSLRSLNVGKNDVVSSSIFVLGFSFDFLTYRIIIFNVFFCSLFCLCT
jgi:non-ribosomal peptide synthetase component E (peptide arylation enzyme)